MVSVAFLTLSHGAHVMDAGLIPADSDVPISFPLCFQSFPTSLLNTLLIRAAGHKELKLAIIQ